jgi:kumamolisin
MVVRTTMIAIPGSKRAPVPQAKLLGRSDPDHRIKVSIYARRNPQAPAEAAANLATLSAELPGERRYLNDQQFKRRLRG